MRQASRKARASCRRFSGSRRPKAHAERIEIAFLDSDSGAPLHEISGSIERFGWPRSSALPTRHITKQTIVRRGHWDRFAGKHSGRYQLAESFLLRQRSTICRPSQLARKSRRRTQNTSLLSTVSARSSASRSHCCDRGRRPSSDQEQANAALADRVAALAAALRLEHDQACIDTSRLFYLPRRPENGPTPEIAIVEGAPCDIFGLPSVSVGAPSGSQRKIHRRRDKVEPYTDPDTDEIVDLFDGRGNAPNISRSWFVYGPGGNGKSVMLMTVAGILGAYAATAAMDTFTASHSDRHPTDLAMLDGARMVIATETDEGRAWAEARIKALTGGDAITARFMREDFFTFTPAFKLTISGNHKPTLSNVDDAARRRFNIAPFLNKPARPDSHLVETLKREWPGILRWMIEGCLAWQRETITPQRRAGCHRRLFH